MNAPLRLDIAGSAAIAEEFRWPAPPYFEFVREQDRFDWAECLLILRDGTAAGGQMHSFVPDQELLTFQPDGAGETVSLAFSSLLKLKLGRPVEVRRETPFPGISESDALPYSESEPFRIDLASGELFEGVTRGYVRALCGLFLYLPQANGSVIRCFVPAHAADACSIDAPIGQILINQKAVSPEAVGAALNLQAIMRTQNFDRFLTENRIPIDVSRGVPEPGGQRRRTLPQSQGARAAARAAPAAKALIETPRAVSQIRIVPAAPAPQDIGASSASNAAANAAIEAPAASLRKNHGRIAPPARNEIGVQDLVARLAASSGDLDVPEQQAGTSDSALVMLVNRIILDAVEQKASDIHIEANLGPKATRVRFRKDGTLVNYLDLPAQFRNAVVSRIKIMSQLDITERRKPQDGKIDFSRFGPAPVELRIATVPTTSGLEDVVMRVLAASSPVPVAELGLDQEALQSVKRLISKPHGLFLVCGPTGSGKTTTLHSLLAFLNTAERKIWTAEDPIEITQAGLRQVQVNAKIGWTFAVAMRSFMRADPDVIMVGEMRDAETAKIGIEASLTGHLVLSTLHTNSGPESIVRLLDLGMDPFNFADALLGVLAQRLAKRLCPECKIGYAPDSAELKRLLLEYCDDTPIDAREQLQGWVARHGGAHGQITLFRAHGCEHCDDTGYHGRIGLHELLVADPTTRQLIQSRAPVAEVKGAAMLAGLRTLKQDGIEKVLQGLTDMRQVNAVCS